MPHGPLASTEGPVPHRARTLAQTRVAGCIQIKCVDAWPDATFRTGRPRLVYARDAPATVNVELFVQQGSGGQVGPSIG
jgi:hypothetical protein